MTQCGRSLLQSTSGTAKYDRLLLRSVSFIVQNLTVVTKWDVTVLMLLNWEYLLSKLDSLTKYEHDWRYSSNMPLRTLTKKKSLQYHLHHLVALYAISKKCSYEVPLIASVIAKQACCAISSFSLKKLL